ncbi:MAG: T9SS type A sorting domain-containing protein [Bacteroidota bacterium]
MKKIILIILIAFSSSYVKATNYAILVSAGLATIDDAFSNSEYWYDLYLSYEDLIIKEGYDEDNVFVFYGAGSDFTATTKDRYKIGYHGWTNPITDFNNSYSTLVTQFTAIGNTITSNDNVVIRWVVGHGGNAGSNDNYSALIQNTSQNVSEAQIQSLVSLIPNYNRKSIIWMTCMSGCLVKGSSTLNYARTSVLTSSDWDEYSYGAYYPEGHAELNYVVNSSLYGQDYAGTTYNGDQNNDHIISFNELYLETQNSTPAMQSETQLGNACSIANRDYISESILLDNATISNTQDYATRFINANNCTVSSSGIVHFVAQEKTVLSIGFHASSSCQFHAYLSNETCAGVLKEVNNSTSNNNEVEENEYFISQLHGVNQAVSENNSESSFDLYPNPANGAFTIQVNNITSEEGIHIEVVNYTGKIIESLVTNTSKCVFDLSNQPKGIYLVRVKHQDKIFTKKLIIQ